MSEKAVIFNALAVLLMCVCFVEGKKSIDFDECCLAHGKEALPYILKGDKEYNLPNLTPFIIPSVTMDSNNLKVVIRDLQLHGFDTVELKKVKIDLDNKKVVTKILFGVINLIGDYQVDGKILMFPLQGGGNCNITGVGVDVEYSINYKLVNRDGDDYFAVDTATVDFTCEMVYADIKKILGDNKELGESINKAINDNRKELMESFKPIISETIVQVGNVIINGVCTTVPFNEVFLD